MAQNRPPAAVAWRRLNGAFIHVAEKAEIDIAKTEVLNTIHVCMHGSDANEQAFELHATRENRLNAAS